jgi:hypothetical protein
VAGSRASRCGCEGEGVCVCGWCWEACAYTSTGGCDACGARCACCSMAASLTLTMGRRMPSQTS